MRGANNNHQRHAVPPMDRVTVEYMERLFPARSPDPTDPEREIWLKAGESRAVRHMRNVLDKQERDGTAPAGMYRV